MSHEQKDLIISGFIKRIEDSLSIVIPEDIKKVLVILYSRYNDKWNKELLNEKTPKTCINGQYFEPPDKKFHSILSNHVIHNNKYYEWKIKIIKNILYFYVGLVIDNHYLIKRHLEIGHGIILVIYFMDIKLNFMQ